MASCIMAYFTQPLIFCTQMKVSVFISAAVDLLSIHIEGAVRQKGEQHSGTYLSFVRKGRARNEFYVNIYKYNAVYKYSARV